MASDAAAVADRRGGAALAATVAELAAWAGLLLVAYAWGRAIAGSGQVIRLGAAPLGGWYDWRLNGRALIPVTVGVALVAGLPSLAQTVRWRWLLALSFAATAIWAVALASTDGWYGITNPTVLRGDEYLLDVPQVEDPGLFLQSFTDDIDRYVTHVRSHPPGMLLGLWGMDRIGLGGPGWAAALCIGGGAAAVPAVLVALRQVAGEDRARRALPFMVVAPVALWVATTADALFAGVAAWSVAALVLALYRRDRLGDLLALAGGLGLGILAHLSYGGVLITGVLLAVAVHQRRLRPLVLAGLGSLVVLASFAAAGFWWLDGLAATGREYRESVASSRPYGYFVVANMAALGVVLGPALAVALSRLRDRRTWLLVGGALAACLVANLSGLSKGEVERIWLPFAVWILPAGWVLARRGAEAAGRRWLALQAGFAVLVQLAVRSRW